MATKTNNEAATVETGGFSNIARLTDLKSELMECCVGMEFSMDRIKMPSGVSKFFTVPADGEEEQQVAEIVGIILHSHPSFSYYTTTYQGGSNPPDCGSFDGRQGIGSPGGDCRKCPHNRFGSGTEGQGKACQNRKMLYILQEGELLPMMLSLPVGSVRKFEDFVKLWFAKHMKLPHQMVVKISLKKAHSNATNRDFSQAVFQRVRDLTDGEKSATAPYVQQMREYAKNLTTAALIPVDEEIFVDTETGEIIPALK
jgi:hypothetical protein|nr:hypothetical protein [uncultured Selenomonas sp.]